MRRSEDGAFGLETLDRIFSTGYSTFTAETDSTIQSSPYLSLLTHCQQMPGGYLNTVHTSPRSPISVPGVVHLLEGGREGGGDWWNVEADGRVGGGTNE